MRSFAITSVGILARRRCHYGDCLAFRSLELGKCRWPLQAALSGSIIKAPGFAGGYLLLIISNVILGHAARREPPLEAVASMTTVYFGQPFDCLQGLSLAIDDKASHSLLNHPLGRSRAGMR